MLHDAQVSFPLLLVRVQRLLGQHYGLQLKDLHLTPTQAEIISFIATHGESTVIRLAAFFQVQSPVMTELVDILVRQGRLQRRTDPADRRRTLVAFTEAGQALVPAIDAHREAMLTRITRILKPTELQQLEIALLALQDAFIEDHALLAASRKSQRSRT